MKQLIKWLTNVSGVEKQIRLNEQKILGENLPYKWVVNSPDAYNALWIYSERLKEGKGIGGGEIIRDFVENYKGINFDYSLTPITKK